MILTFHKVSHQSPTAWWITNDDFARMLDELNGKTFVYLEDYDPEDPTHVVLTFDGPYEVNLEFAFPELSRREIPFEVFVIGDYIGQDNSFDSVEPLTTFCSLIQLEQIVELGGRLEWHTRTHQLKASASEAAIEHEFKVPDHLSLKFPNHFKHFAYPHGKATNQMKVIAQKYFSSALAVDGGNIRDKFEMPRITVFLGHSFRRYTLTLLVMNYNYGRFLLECLDSIKRQSIRPDEIHIIDDFSSDHSRDLLKILEGEFKVFLNEFNLGIVDNFNQAMSRVSTDLAMFVGADNYLHPNTLEFLLKEFNEDSDLDICYFDMTLVGPLARNLANQVSAKEIGYSSRDNLDVFWWEFPEFNDESRQKLEKENFINGSAMFKTDAFRRVGGYARIYPEDHNLWFRMIQGGSNAKRVPLPLLYYRQHSVSQANTSLGNALEVQYLRSRLNSFLSNNKGSVLTDEELIRSNEELRDKLESLQNSTIWKLTKPLRVLISLLRS